MKRILALVAFATVASPAFAEEGMWTLNGFPKDLVKKKYGLAITDTWLDHVRLSSVRLARGCSGSFVSDAGLVLTNHHCAESCLNDNSTAQRDLVKNGFTSKGVAEELKCPGVELNQLVDIKDVTKDVNAATQGLSGEKYNGALKAAFGRMEKACSENDKFRCDVVTLYHGGLYNLYKYRKYRDVRLVMAPEFQMAFFGGDPDNFMYPRYDLDVSFLRAYEDDKPARTPDFLKWNPAGPKEGELVFTSGHPGRTARLLTVAELEFQRDYEIPRRLMYAAELRGVLTEFARRGPEQKRIGQEDLFFLENGYKARRGMFESLTDKEFFGKKVADEQALRKKIAKDPAKQKLYGNAWDEVARAEQKFKNFHVRYAMVEGGAGYASDLFHMARTLVRGAAERALPDDKRLGEFHEAALPGLTHELFSPAPIYPELDEVRLSYSLNKLRELLKADDPFVKKVLGVQSPEELAHALVSGSKLADVAARKALWNGGEKAVEASTDPMIQFARLVDPDSRAIRKRYEDEIEAPIKKNSELIAKAMFDVYGTSVYPDATFTLRISVGEVKGYEENGTQVPAFTTIGGAFDRATGRDPYALPKSWLDAKSRVKLDTPFNFVTSNDIIGGNSGSPVVDRDAQVVGLIFDGNIQSLGADYGFDPATYRAVAVDTAALTETLKDIYGADRLVNEILGKGGANRN